MNTLHRVHTYYYYCYLSSSLLLLIWFTSALLPWHTYVCTYIHIRMYTYIRMYVYTYIWFTSALLPCHPAPTWAKILKTQCPSKCTIKKSQYRELFTFFLSLLYIYRGQKNYYRAAPSTECTRASVSSKYDAAPASWTARVYSRMRTQTAARPIRACVCVCVCVRACVRVCAQILKSQSPSKC